MTAFGGDIYKNNDFAQDASPLSTMSNVFLGNAEGEVFVFDDDDYPN